MAKLSIAAILVTLFMGSAQAGVIYSEAVNGDLAAQDTVDLGFSIGSNSVLGRSSFGTDGVDFDGFLFHLGVGQTLTNVIFSAFDQVVVGQSGLTSTWDLKTGGHSGGVLSSSTANILDSSDQDFFVGALPLGEGVYAFSPVSMTAPGGVASSSWSYEIIFDVQGDNRVPEPESLALFGLGLAGLAVSRRKKKLA